MKTINKLIPIFLFMSASNHTFSQNIECGYISTNIISDDVQKIEDPNIRNMVTNRLSNEKQPFTLRLSNGIYLFEPAVGNQENKGIMKMGGASAIYMDMNKQVTISQEKILDHTFLIREAMKTYKWDITTESKEIFKKKCTKATLREEPSVTAWFTTDIPIAFGPMGYYGLPGLILQLETATKQYFIQEVSIPKDSMDIKVPVKGKKISREDFEKLKKEKEKSFGINQGDGSKIKIIKM